MKRDDSGLADYGAYPTLCEDDSVARRWPDLWMDETVELLAGCVLLVVSGSWWFHVYGGLFASWHNALLSATAVLGPWFVVRAWKRRSEERDRAHSFALDVMNLPGVSEVIAQHGANEGDQPLAPD